MKESVYRPLAAIIIGGGMLMGGKDSGKVLDEKPTTVSSQNESILIAPPLTGPSPPTSEELGFEISNYFTKALEQEEENKINELQQQLEEEKVKLASAPPVWPASYQPCDGDYPPCSVVEHESHGDYNAFNPTGCNNEGCGGKWQFAMSTWNNYMGYPTPQDAPPEIQDQKAKELWNGGKGCTHWSAC